MQPWLLLGLALLPGVWWLLHAVPPQPRAERFPAIQLLHALGRDVQSPEITPWWVIMLRMLLAALIIVGVSRPILNPSISDIPGDVVLLVVDDGWAAAAKWEARQAELSALIAQAERNGQQIMLLTTAQSEDTLSPNIMPPAAASGLAASLQPKPWGLDRAAAARRIRQANLSDTKISTVWLSDGMAAQDDRAGAVELAQTLVSLGYLRLISEAAPDDLSFLLEPRGTPDGFDVRLLRPQPGPERTVEIRAIATDGRVLAATPIAFARDKTGVTASVSLPVAVRNELARLELGRVASAGAVWLLDDQWKRRAVGVVSGGNFDAAQPLLDDVFYLERAMQPFAEVRKGTLDALLGVPLSMLVLADIGKIVGGDRAKVEHWIEQGGVLVRFAGPRMANNTDDLLPVRLRLGGRALDGALSWAAPAKLTPFADSSPFHGLQISSDVLVQQQILAEPDVDLTGKTWASLQDGTPLVTAERRGKGWVVLFHITANTRWSTLPLSGLYVSMLQRISEMASNVARTTDTHLHAQQPLNPLLMLDGRGRLHAPQPHIRPLLPAQSAAPAAGPQTPPGYYGTPEFRRAVNPQRDANSLGPMPPLPANINQITYGPRPERELRPWLLSAAMLLLLTDGVISLGMRGHLPRLIKRRSLSGAIGILMALGVSGEDCAMSQQAWPELDQKALDAVLNTRLAYMVTGDAGVDTMSAAGLLGLTRILRERTAFSAAGPVGVRPDQDELVFYPLLYWPISEHQQSLSGQALARIDAYMKNGGTILFDTRDQLINFQSQQSQTMLRKILGGLDIPPLVQAADNHVLGKSFYLLTDFPGRYAGGQLWVEAPDAAASGPNGNDNVSSIVIGANDWAAAWAVDAAGRPLAPVSPGGARQREMAYRFGVNLVMYALTGNYKADQVHTPILLERLGE